MDTTKNNGTISIRLHSGKELRLSSSDKDMQLDVCSLQYHLEPTDSRDTEKPDSSTTQTTTAQHLPLKQRTMDRNQQKPGDGATAVSKTKALHGLVNAIIYLETFAVFSRSDIESLWDIYERINSKYTNQQYLRDLGEVSNVILATGKHGGLVKPEVLVEGKHGYGGVSEPDENVDEEKEDHYELDDAVTQMYVNAEPLDTPEYHNKEVPSVPSITTITDAAVTTNNMLSGVNARQIYDGGVDRNTNRLDLSESVPGTHHIDARPLEAVHRIDVKPLEAVHRIDAKPLISVHRIDVMPLQAGHRIAKPLQARHRIDAKPVRETNRVYRCDKCSRRFKRQYLHQAHMRMHDGIVPFKCKICDRIYQNSTSFRNHMGLHNNVSHLCYVCGKSFYNTGLLSTHMRSHDEVWRHVCSVCGKRSATSSTNLNHMKIHTDERNHPCDLCGKSFRRRCDVKYHKRKVHKDS